MNYRAIESALAKETIDQIVKQPLIQASLFEIAAHLHAHVFKPFYASVTSKKDFAEFTKPEQQVIHTFALKHSEADKKIGALFPESSYENLKTEELPLLLQKISEVLTNKEPLTTREDVIQFLKVLDDMGHCFCSGAVPINNFEEYKKLKKMVYPSFEENDLRRPRTEAGQNMLAVSYGVGIEIGKDLIRADDLAAEKKEGCFSGKAKFYLPDLAERLQVLLAQFNQLSLSETLKIEIDVATEKLYTAKREIPANVEKITELKAQREKLLDSLCEPSSPHRRGSPSPDIRLMIKRLQYYKIPLTKVRLTETELEIFRNRKTHFEKLAVDEEKNPLPLLASASNSTSRLLIAAYHTGALNRVDGSFDTDKAMVLTNCLVGYFGHCSHHSVTEVKEIYNRLLDYVALYHREQLPKKWFDTLGYAEDNLPYHCNYFSMLSGKFNNAEIKEIVDSTLFERNVRM